MVPNTIFELSSSPEMNEAIQYTTESNGYIQPLELDAGTYYFREHIVPEPLFIDTTIKTVEIKEGQKIEVTIPEKAATSKFSVSGLKKSQETTDAQGIAKFFVPVGNDTLKETKAPQGYKLSNESHELVVTG